MATGKKKGPKYDHLLKLLLIGDSGVGKSCILLRYSDDSFTSSYITTIGIDFKIKNLEIQSSKVKLQIWDTAGQERFRTITHNYYRGAHGIMLAYDCTKEESFKNVRQWIKDVRVYAEQNVNLVLIGNKCDLETKKKVERLRGENFAKDYGIPFFETSALNNNNVEEAFETLVREVCQRKFANAKKEAKEGENVDMDSEKTESKCC